MTSEAIQRSIVRVGRGLPATIATLLLVGAIPSVASPPAGHASADGREAMGRKLPGLRYWSRASREQPLEIADREVLGRPERPLA